MGNQSSSTLVQQQPENVDQMAKTPKHTHNRQKQYLQTYQQQQQQKNEPPLNHSSPSAETMPSLTDTTRSSSCNGSPPISPTNMAKLISSPTANNANTNLSTHSEVSNMDSTTPGNSLRSTNYNSSLRSHGSGSTHTTVQAARLAHNLMRTQHRDPMEIYKLVNVLGEGSMGSVSKVRKRSSAVGGSARASFRALTNPADIPVIKQLTSKDGGQCCIPLFEFVVKVFPTKENSLREVVPDKDAKPFRAYTYPESNRSDMTNSNTSTDTNGDTNTNDNNNNPKEAPARESSSMISYNSSNTTDAAKKKRREHVYALKSILLDKCADSRMQKELIHEIAILREIDNPHIARAIETFDYKGQLYIVLELCSGGDLYTRDPYTERESGQIVCDVLSAVSYLHSKGIIHRDLKFENIMFVDKRPEAEVKLIDFGLSQKFAGEERLSDAVGTVYTMAPELLAGQYNAKADVWSLGVIAYMLLSSSMPFFGSTRYEVMKQICKGKVKFSSRRWKKVTKYGKGIVLHLLESDPAERPSADRALKYCKKWIQQLDEEEWQNNASLTADTNSASQAFSSLVDGASQNSTPAAQRQKHLRWMQSNSFGSSGDIEMMDKIQASIQAFSQYNTLKRLALMVIAYKSTASEIGWLRSTFQQFDILQNGEISLEEFSEALSEVYDYTEEELEMLFAGMDVDGTGSVHYTEFLAATIEAHGSIDEDRIADAFDRIDCDDSGYITLQNLEDFLGTDVPRSYIEAIIDDADKLKDKRISYEEFLQLWDPACDATLLQCKREVAERRMRRTESLIDASTIASFDESNTIDIESDEDQAGVYFDNFEMNENPTELQLQQVPTKIMPVNEKEVTEELVPLSGDDKTPKPKNMGAHEFGAIDCFSQRKALSLRAWE